MQVKNSFDKETLKKILKGAFWAVSPVASIALLEYLGTIKIDNTMIAMFVAWFVPTAINAIKEYKKGDV